MQSRVGDMLPSGESVPSARGGAVRAAVLGSRAARARRHAARAAGAACADDVSGKTSLNYTILKKDPTIIIIIKMKVVLLLGWRYHYYYRDEGILPLFSFFGRTFLYNI